MRMGSTHPSPRRPARAASTSSRPRRGATRSPSRARATTRPRPRPPCASPVFGASVAAYNTSNPTGRTQLIMTNTTNAAGLANLTLWPAVFLIRASAPDLETDQSVDVSLTSSTTINLVAGPRIFGHVLDSSNNPLDAVVAWLYNPAAPNSSAYRLIPATVSGSLYDIHAPAGTYTLIVDADHFLSHKASVTLPTTNPNDLVLQAAPPELNQTTVGYGANDWSNLTIWRNVTL